MSQTSSTSRRGQQTRREDWWRFSSSACFHRKMSRLFGLLIQSTLIQITCLHALLVSHSHFYFKYISFTTCTFYLCDYDLSYVFWLVLAYLLQCEKYDEKWFSIFTNIYYSWAGFKKWNHYHLHQPPFLLMLFLSKYKTKWRTHQNVCLWLGEDLEPRDRK